MTLRFLQQFTADIQNLPTGSERSKGIPSDEKALEWNVSLKQTCSRQSRF